LAGWLLLSLPFSMKEGISSLDALFTSVSAISTTGLVTIDIGSTLTHFGLFVVLILIQLGGIGYMTFGSFIVLSRSNRL
jgi:trk system potassium uptake protein TrkH